MTSRVPSTTDKPQGFGSHRPRRRTRAIPKSDPGLDAKLVEDYLRRNGVTRCETRYAEGAVKTSGAYDFG